MIRPILLALMFSGSVFALSGTAYAQTSPDTRQTDQSEEDWRKSQKKGGTSSEDILDIIKNTRSSGVGNGRGYSPIDALPEESRRHLMKERAKRMAQAGPNEPVDVSYTPSEAAKSDSDLESDEKAAWEQMAKSMNGAPDQGQQGQGGQGGQDQSGQGQQGQQGQQGRGSSSQGQGQQGSQGQQQGSGQSRSVMRGGSANSVADIMNRIKGLGQGGSSTGQGQGQAPQGQSGQGTQGQGTQGQGGSQGQNSQGQQGQQGQQSGQAQSGQNQQGQSQQGQAQQGQSQSAQTQQGQSQPQAQAQNQGQNPSQSQQQGQQQSDSQSDAQAQAQAQAEADAKAASQAEASAQNQDASRAPEAISPLDRIKQVNREQSTTGTRSSASDYLKKSD